MRRLHTRVPGKLAERTSGGGNLGVVPRRPIQGQEGVHQRAARYGGSFRPLIGARRWPQRGERAAPAGGGEAGGDSQAVAPNAADCIGGEEKAALAA
jgi:hypothetical protein